MAAPRVERKRPPQSRLPPVLVEIFAMFKDGMFIDSKFGKFRGFSLFSPNLIAVTGVSSRQDFCCAVAGLRLEVSGKSPTATLIAGLIAL